MEMTVPSQGHRKPIAGQYPSPLRSRAGAPGGDRETAASGRRGSETSPVSSGVLSRLTWAAERPGGSEAAEATNCPGGHHLVQKRTKVVSASSPGGQAEDFSSSSPALARRPTYCLTKTPIPNCRRPLSVALPFRIMGRKKLFLHWKEGGPWRRGAEPSFPVRRTVGQPRD